MSDEEDYPPYGIVGSGASSSIDLPPVPLNDFAAAVSFEVVTFVPWPTSEVPVAYPAPAIFGFGPAYIISASDDDVTSVRAAAPGHKNIRGL